MSTKTYYFCTGVKPYIHRPPAAIMPGDVLSSNGVRLIPYECEEVPDGYTLAFACPYPNLYPEVNYLIREITGGKLLSKFAYFTKK